MLDKLQRYGLAAVLAMGTFAVATSAEGRDRQHHGGGGDAAAIIGAGIVGLAIGALIADSDDDHYYDRGYYPSRRYVSVHGYPDHYYYYDGFPNRYYRDRYYGRYYGNYYSNYYSRRHNNRWNRGYNRADRYYGRGRGNYNQSRSSRGGGRRGRN
jgi:hypothetical protein